MVRPHQEKPASGRGRVTAAGGAGRGGHQRPDDSRTQSPGPAAGGHPDASSRSLGEKLSKVWAGGNGVPTSLGPSL